MSRSFRFALAHLGGTSLLSGVLIISGCSQSPPANPAANSNVAGISQLAQSQEGGHLVGGWWCGEHGIPETECSMCSAKVAAEFQRKGDWCKDHERAKSQCFVCEPEAKERFAALYRAKHGTEPPAVKEY